MLEPIYGIRLDGLVDNRAAASWEEVWKARSFEEWRELGDRFSFEYVVAPVELGLDLRRLFTGSTDAFYSLERP